MNYIWCKVTWKTGFEHQYEIVNTRKSIDANKTHLENMRWVDSYELSDKQFKIRKRKA